MRKKAEKALRPRLSLLQRETLLRHILILPHLYSRALDLLKEEYFNQEGDDCLQITWFAAKRLIKRVYMGKLPKPDLLWYALPGEIQALVETGEIVLGQDTEERIFADNGLLARMFDSDRGVDNVYGETLLADFLREKEVVDKLNDLASVTASHVPLSLSQELHDLRLKDLTLSAMGSSTGQQVMPDDWECQSIAIEPTGVDFLDTYMNGGDAPGEVYGIAGAFGSGKTALACQIACEKANIFYRKHLEEGSPLRFSHLFFYEGTSNELRRRLITYSAGIHKDSLEGLGDWSGLSTKGNLKPYEEELFAEQIRVNGADNIDGEYERLITVRKRLNRNILVHDFSGSEGADGKAFGYGYVEEIASSLRRCAENGQLPGAVFIDYVNLCCRQHITARGLSEKDSLRHLAGGFGMLCRQLIAEPFKCSVYLFQQLNYSVNSRGFGSTLSLSDMAEARNFGENLVFVFGMGPMHKESKTYQFFSLKTRRAPGVSKPMLIKFDGHIGKMSLDSEHIISATIGSPVAKEDVEVVIDTLDVPETVSISSETYDLSEHE